MWVDRHGDVHVDALVLPFCVVFAATLVGGAPLISQILAGYGLVAVGFAARSMRRHADRTVTVTRRGRRWRRER